MVQEGVPGQRVQGGGGFVEDQQLGPFGRGEGQGELGTLAAGEPAGLLPGNQADPGEPAAGECRVPGRVEPAAHPQVVGDGQVGVDRRVLGDEADPGQVGRSGGGSAAQHADRARGGLDQPAGQLQQGRFAGSVRADQADHPAGRDGQVAVGERVAAAVALAQLHRFAYGCHVLLPPPQPRELRFARHDVTTRYVP